MAARGNLPIGENLNLSSPFAVQRVGRSGRSCWPMEGGTMKDSIGNEYGVPAVVDRDRSRPSWTHCGFERKLTHAKATRLRRPADGSPWSRWMAPHRSLASVAR